MSIAFIRVPYIYEHENCPLQVTAANAITTTGFVYDGDGNRVSKTVTINGTSTTTSYVGNYYEVTNGATTSYYYLGSQRVAMRDANGVTFFHVDQLGSTSLTTGAESSTQKYFHLDLVKISAQACTHRLF